MGLGIVNLTLRFGTKVGGVGNINLILGFGTKIGRFRATGFKTIGVLEGFGYSTWGLGAEVGMARVLRNTNLL